MCEQVRFVQVFTVIPPRLSYPCNCINCRPTANKIGTGADDAFDLKHGVQRDITRPSHGSLQVQISLSQADDKWEGDWGGEGKRIGG